MRRYQSPWGGLRARPNLVLVMLAAAIAASSGTAYAVQPSAAELAMAERPAPPGDGWSLVSSSVPSASPVAPTTSTPAPSPAAAAGGWQALAADSKAGEPAPVATPTNEIEVTVPPAAPAAPPAEPFALVGGKSLQAQILAWAKRSGWAIDWRTPDDWIVPNDKAFGTDFEAAVQAVFDLAEANGGDMRADVWEGNRSIVVDKTGAEQ